MKKILLYLFVAMGMVSFSNCDIKAEKLIQKVIRQKLKTSSKDNLKYFKPEILGDEYRYTVFEDQVTHTVNRAFIVIDISKGIAYKENIAEDKLEKILQDRKSICKNTSK